MKTINRLVKLVLLPLGFITAVCAFGSWVPLQEDGSVFISTAPNMGSRSPASVDSEFPFLSFEQIKNSDPKFLYDYYQRIYKIMLEIETINDLTLNGKLTEKKSSSLFNFIDQAFAIDLSAYSSRPNTAVGKRCLIGGYWGEWSKKPVRGSNGNLSRYRISCDSPNRCRLPSGGSGHKCNPSYFTYSPKTGKAYCADIRRDLTTSQCINKFIGEEVKGSMKTEKQFIAHFKAGLIKSIQADAKYQGISPQKALQRRKREITSEHKDVEAYCGIKETCEKRDGSRKPNCVVRDDWKKHQWGQDKSCFRLIRYYNNHKRVVAQVERNPEQLRRPVTVPSPRYSRTRNAERTYRGGQSGYDGDFGIGKFSCVKMGRNVSNRYIAMHMVRLRDGGKISRRQKTDAQVMKGLISRMSHYGYCKKGYHNGPVSPKINSWVRGRSQISDRRKLLIFRTPSRRNNRSFEKTFGVSYDAVKSMDLGYRGQGRNRNGWQKARNIRNSSLGSRQCGRGTTKWPGKRIKNCKKMAAACGIPKRKRNFCNDPDPLEAGEGQGSTTGGSGGPDGGGTTGGSTTGGSTTGGSTTGGSTTGGSTTGGSTTGGSTTGSGGEVGAGSNAGSGHGADSSPGQGAGPGTSQ